MAKRRNLNGKVVAITGGARGIGKATAEALSAKGARIAIGDLDHELAEQTAAGLGGGAIALELDVTERESFATFLEEASRQLGEIDVVINNAGIMPVGRFKDETDDSARRQIDINIHGVIYGSKLALERMLPRRSGHIVNIASAAGKTGVPGVATYAGTKHFVVGMSEALRGELRDSGIDVSVVMPSIVNTELTHGYKETKGVAVMEPEDVADAIVAALEKPKFDVWVPKLNGAITRVLTPLPRRVKEGIAQAMGVDKVLLEADQSARAGYEDRAAHSEPSVDAERENA